MIEVGLLIEMIETAVFKGRVSQIIFVMDSVHVGKAVFVKESFTTPGTQDLLPPGEISYHVSVCWVNKHIFNHFIV